MGLREAYVGLRLISIMHLITSYKKLIKVNKAGSLSFFLYKIGIIIALAIILFGKHMVYTTQ